MGRVLITTSIYALNWLKTKVFDPWQAGDPLIDVIPFDSTENPAFPKDEFERARRDLPRARFEMMYRGLFTQPAGLVYDCFDRRAHTCPRFTIPHSWKRFLGLDFGTQNMAAVFLAQEPETRRLYVYRTYHAGGRSVQGHIRQLCHGEPGLPYCVGGSRGEQDWRDEFRRAGLGVRAPDIADVQVGIDRVYGAFQRGEIIVIDDLTELFEEVETYSRVLDEAGNATETIQDIETYHLLDALRYIVGALRPSAPRVMKSARMDWFDKSQGWKRK